MKRSATNLSRRALVKNAGLAAGAGLLGLGQEKGLYSQSQAAAGATGQPRILALIGDRHHNADYIRVSLDKVFKEMNVSVNYTIEYDKISANMLQGLQHLPRSARGPELVGRLSRSGCSVGLFQES